MPAMKEATVIAKFERAVEVLIRTGSRREAAKAVHSSVSTLERWHADERFMEMLRKARSMQAYEVAAEVSTGLHDAISTLKRNLNCGHPGSEIKAASTLLDLSLKLTDLTELKDRIEALEQRGTADAHA